MTTPDPSREAFEKTWRTDDRPETCFAAGWQAAMAHKGSDCWQPIETAPKDGTNFLALIGDQPYEARFDESGRVVRFIHTNFDCKPTHWAPLPAAPKQEGST